MEGLLILDDRFGHFFIPPVHPILDRSKGWISPNWLSEWIRHKTGRKDDLEPTRTSLPQELAQSGPFGGSRLPQSPLPRTLEGMA